jgi:hypothetical protein
MPLVGGRSGYVSAEPVAARFASLINTLDGIARQVLHQVPPDLMALIFASTRKRASSL